MKAKDRTRQVARNEAIRLLKNMAVTEFGIIGICRLKLGDKLSGLAYGRDVKIPQRHASIGRLLKIGSCRLHQVKHIMIISYL